MEVTEKSSDSSEETSEGRIQTQKRFPAAGKPCHCRDILNRTGTDFLASIISKAQANVENNIDTMWFQMPY